MITETESERKNIVEWVKIEKIASENGPLNSSEEVWLNSITDNLHLKECESSDEVVFDEEGPLMMLK